MKRGSWLGVWLAVLLLLAGCGTKIEQALEKDESKEIEEAETLLVMRSYLSGMEIEPERLHLRPMVVMMDNHPHARWQQGIAEADLVYEIPVEGTYTRYMAVYLTNEPELLGSVRSARPYFVRLAEEYEAVYVHAGGSEEAKNLAQSSACLINMDAIIASSQEFWRVEHKKAPHNLYTSSEAIRNFEANSGRELEIEGLERFLFDAEAAPSGIDAPYVEINYFSDNQTAYSYDSGLRAYRRVKDGAVQVDECDEQELIVTNIITQEVESHVIDNEGRLAVDVIGEGKGMLYSQGRMLPITWHKSSAEDITTYALENGDKLTLLPGQTWIQLIDQRTTVSYEKEDA